MKRLLYMSLMVLLAGSAYSQYQYLGTYNGDGVPDYLDGRDNVPSSLLDDIAASLPESQPVPTYNPQLISSGYDTDIVVTDSADVWVTFVDEGAGYRNVLGFYTYDLSNPYTSAPPQNEVTIIFPNVSKQFSGGGLITGDRVKIGTFPPNTGIGWVLIANAWSSGSVGSGNWILYSNPDFNPESNASDRYHNVLLNDTENNLIVLGFEDIRRDLPSCDQDFNDALFYVTANPIEAISRDNFATITRSDESSSGNNGGLESNGELATAIAQRNYMRTKAGNARNVKVRQSSLAKYKSNARLSGVHEYLPEHGFTGREESLISSPEDLIQLTNAREVFAADYYIDSKRVSAALVTSTDGAVYNHTKSVCDRLNGGALNDVRYVNLRGLDIIYAEILTDQNNREYAAWFSARETEEAYELISLWNIGDYPAGDYLNFQAWGSTPAQVFSTLNYVLDKLEAEKTIDNTSLSLELPKVYAKQGVYKNGKLHLDLINQTGAKQVTLSANIRATEFANSEKFEQTISLTGSREESIIVETGFLFDAGISIRSESTDAYDALYLADGAWGVDYNKEFTDVTLFSIAPSTIQPLEEEYLVERGFEIEGESTDVLNVFRNLRAGNSFLDPQGYLSLQFDIRSNTPIEVSIIEKELVQWENRLRTTIPVHKDGFQTVLLDLNGFMRGDGTSGQIGEVQSVVFSYLNQTGDTEKVSFAVKDVIFGRRNVVTALETDLAKNTGFLMYPNPARSNITLSLPESAQISRISIVNLQGSMVLDKAFNGSVGNIVKMDLALKSGFYNVLVQSDQGVHTSSLVVME